MDGALLVFGLPGIVLSVLPDAIFSKTKAMGYIARMRGPKPIEIEFALALALVLLALGFALLGGLATLL